MRTIIFSLIAALVVGGLGFTHTSKSAHAARSPATEYLPKSDFEVIVFESPRCPYCSVFRRDVVPQYQNSKRAHEAPMRFVNVYDVDVRSMGLSSPLSVVPTVVLMFKGHEIDRINGYMGPDPFFYMVSRNMN